MKQQGRGDAPRTKSPSVSYRTYRPGDDEAIVALLNRAFQPWGTLEQWRLKHRDRPGFKPEEIFVTECDGTIVGCWHAAVRSVRFGPGLTVRLAFDGELAVDPEYRGLGIAEELYRFSNRAFHERGIELRGGFTSTSLWNRFYKPRIGYVTGFDRTRTLQKALSPELVRARLQQALAIRFPETASPEASSASLAAGTPSQPQSSRQVIVELRLKGIEPVLLLLGDRGAQVLTPDREVFLDAQDAKPATGGEARRRLTLSVDQRLFSVAFGKTARFALVLRLLFAGGVRVGGLVHAGPAVARWLIRNRRALSRRSAKRS